MSDASNLNVRSNLMLLDTRGVDKRRFLPGDLVAALDPRLLDTRVIEHELTERQILEYKFRIPCIYCSRTPGVAWNPELCEQRGHPRL